MQVLKPPWGAWEASALGQSQAEVVDKCIPSGKHTTNYGTSLFFLGKSTNSMDPLCAMFKFANCKHLTEGLNPSVHQSPFSRSYPHGNGCSHHVGCSPSGMIFDLEKQIKSKKPCINWMFCSCPKHLQAPLFVKFSALLWKSSRSTGRELSSI